MSQTPLPDDHHNLPNPLAITSTIYYSQHIDRPPSVSPGPNRTRSNPGPFYLIEYQYERLCEAASYFCRDDHAALAKLREGILNDSATLEGNLTDELIQHTKLKGSDARTEAIKLRISIPISRTGRTSATNTEILTIDPPKPFTVIAYGVPSLPDSTLFPDTLDLPNTPAVKWSIYLDTQPTTSTAYTTFKTSNRQSYDAAWNRLVARKPNVSHDHDELLLFDEGDLVTEGTINTVYFLREGRWVTPRVTLIDANSLVSGGFSGGQRGASRRWALDRGLCVEGDVKMRDVEIGEMVWVSNGGRGFGVGVIKRTSET